MGLEPTIYRLEVGRLIHWATRVNIGLTQWAVRGIEPRTTRTQSEYHTTRPHGLNYWLLLRIKWELNPREGGLNPSLNH